MGIKREWWHVPVFQGERLKPTKWCSRSAINAPQQWGRPRVVLVDDIFADDRRDEERDCVLQAVHDNPRHLFLLLTASIWNAKEYLLECPAQPPANFWLGVHIETQDDADRLVPKIIATPAALRFVHATPREAIDIDCTWHRVFTCRIGWLIVEGGADPLYPDHVRLLQDDCAYAKVPFNFAGWGDWLHSDISNLLLREERKAISLETAQWRPDGADVWTGWSRVGARCSGRLLDGVEHNEYPETL